MLFGVARRPTLRGVTRRWMDAYLEAVARRLALAGSRDRSGDAALLFGAADCLVVERLAAGEGFELGPQLRRLATALAAA